MLGKDLLPHVYKPVEMIARLYVLDSITYPHEAEYWLQYAHSLAVLMYEDCDDEEASRVRKLMTNVKRCQALNCAWLID